MRRQDQQRQSNPWWTAGGCVAESDLRPGDDGIEVGAGAAAGSSSKRETRGYSTTVDSFMLVYVEIYNFIYWKKYPFNTIPNTQSILRCSCYRTETKSAWKGHKTCVGSKKQRMSK